MSRFLAIRDANGNITGTAGGRGPVLGVKCSIDVAAGESLIRFHGGIIKKKDVITFAGHPLQTYVALPVPFMERKGPDPDDIKTRLRVSPALVEDVAEGEAVTVVPPLKGRIELTPDDYQKVNGDKYRPMVDTPIWHCSDDGVVTENADTRPKVRFAETDVVADVGEAGVSVALEIVTGDPPTVDATFIDRTLSLETSAGHVLKIAFRSGVGSLGINTSRPGRTTIEAMDLLRVMEPLIVRIRSDSELSRG